MPLPRHKLACLGEQQVQRRPAVPRESQGVWPAASALVSPRGLGFVSVLRAAPSLARCEPPWGPEKAEVFGAAVGAECVPFPLTPGCLAVCDELLQATTAGIRLPQASLLHPLRGSIG